MKTSFHYGIAGVCIIVATSCVHKTSNAYTTDTVKVDTIERDNDFPVDTAPIKPDSLSADTTNKIDSSALVSPIQSDNTK